MYVWKLLNSMAVEKQPQNPQLFCLKLKLNPVGLLMAVVAAAAQSKHLLYLTICRSALVLFKPAWLSSCSTGGFEERQFKEVKPWGSLCPSQQVG